MSKESPSSTADKFVMRFTDHTMRPMLKARAIKNRRSLNAEILLLIDAAIAAEGTKENAPSMAVGEASVAVKSL